MVKQDFMSVTEKDIKEGRINDELGSQLESISANVEAGWEQGRNAWADWRATADERTRQAAATLNNMARENPWQVIGGAAALGFIIGLLFSSRR